MVTVKHNIGFKRTGVVLKRNFSYGKRLYHVFMNPPTSDIKKLYDKVNFYRLRWGMPISELWYGVEYHIHEVRLCPAVSGLVC